MTLNYFQIMKVCELFYIKNDNSLSKLIGVRGAKYFGLLYWQFLYPLLFLALSNYVYGIIPEASQEGSLHSFKNYKDITMFHYTVPKEVLRATWQFAAFMDNGNCPPRKVYIYLQWGSYPIISANNGSYPPHMYIEREYQQVLTTYTDYLPKTMVILPVYSPQPGDWFVGAFLSYWDEKVQQQGLGHKCQYSIGSVATWTKVNDIQSIPIGFQKTMRTTGTESYYKIYISSNVWSFRVHIWACIFKLKKSRNSKEPCIQSMTLQGRSIPSLNHTHPGPIGNLTENEFYTFTEFTPYEDSYYYLLVVSNSIINFNVKVSTTDCPVMNADKSYSQQDFKTDNSLQYHAQNLESLTKDLKINNSVDHRTLFKFYNENHNTMLDEDVTENEQCIPKFQLARIERPQMFSRDYILKGSDWIILSDMSPTILQFDVLPLVDVGGTLDINVYLEIDKKLIEQIITTNICVQRGRVPARVKRRVVCENEQSSLNLSSYDNKNGNLLIPYPQPDLWYITLQVKCYMNNNPVRCQVKKIPISLDMKIRSCVYPGNYSCGLYGTCQDIHQGLLHYSSCDCFDGYKGWGCTDDSNVNFQSSSLLMTLILTISNIFFLPAIYIAIRRNLYAEGLVYFATMLFSSLYHACDQQIMTYCIAKYEVLQYSDFFSSTLALWVTLVSMAELPQQFVSLSHMFGVLIIAYGVESDKTGLSSILVPFCLGILIPIFSYTKYCFKTKIWINSKRIIDLIVGFTLAGFGLLLYCIIETEANYYYVHSIWHATIAISLIFLLPPMCDKQFLPKVTDSLDGSNSVLFQKNATAKSTSLANPLPVITIITTQDNVVTQTVSTP